MTESKEPLAEIPHLAQAFEVGGFSALQVLETLAAMGLRGSELETLVQKRYLQANPRAAGKARRAGLDLGHPKVLRWLVKALDHPLAVLRGLGLSDRDIFRQALEAPLGDAWELPIRKFEGLTFSGCRFREGRLEFTTKPRLDWLPRVLQGNFELRGLEEDPQLPRDFKVRGTLQIENSGGVLELGPLSATKLILERCRNLRRAKVKAKILRIRDCAQLEEIIGGGEQVVVEECPSIETLRLTGIRALGEVFWIRKCSNLKHLELSLAHVDRPEVALVIENCPKLETFSLRPTSYAALARLRISGCDALQTPLPQLQVMAHPELPGHLPKPLKINGGWLVGPTPEHVMLSSPGIQGPLLNHQPLASGRVSQVRRINRTLRWLS